MRRPNDSRFCRSVSRCIWQRVTGYDPPGYDAGKKIKGRKRHILVDTQGLLIHAIVHAANIQDRDGGAFVMATIRS
jgi:Transposase DDE domain